MQGNQRHNWGHSVLGIGVSTHRWPVTTMQGQSVLGIGDNPPSASNHDAGQPTAQLGIFHPKSVHIYFGIKTILAPIIIPSHIGILSIFD
jgi:hypothetical protein